MKKKYLTAIITALVVIAGFAVVYASSKTIKYVDIGTTHNVANEPIIPGHNYSLGELEITTEPEIDPFDFKFTINEIHIENEDGEDITEEYGDFYYRTLSYNEAATESYEAKNIITGECFEMDINADSFATLDMAYDTFENAEVIEECLFSGEDRIIEKEYNIPLEDLELKGIFLLEIINSNGENIHDDGINFCCNFSEYDEKSIIVYCDEFYYFHLSKECKFPQKGRFPIAVLSVVK